MPLRRPAPTGSITLNCGDDPARGFCISEADQYLVQNDIIQNRVTFQTQPLCHECGLPAIPLDDFSNALAAQRLQCRPDLNSTCPSGRLRRKVTRLAILSLLQVAGAGG